MCSPPPVQHRPNTAAARPLAGGLLLALSVLALPLPACEDPWRGESDAPGASSSHAPPAAAVPRPIVPEETGSLLVRVRLVGEPPAPRPLDVAREPLCSHGDPLVSEAVVAPEGRLGGVLVHVTAGHEGWLPPEPPAEPARLRQEGCAYLPHVLALRVGRPLLIENLDPLVHNVHLRARRNPDSNQVQAAGAAELVYEFHRAELSIPVQCDIHPWMGAWLHVLDNPWFAVSDGAGEARIEGLPAGKYSVELLHEALGRRQIEVRIEAGEVTELEASFGS